MTQHAKYQAYAGWLKQRGQRFPASTQPRDAGERLSASLGGSDSSSATDDVKEVGFCVGCGSIINQTDAPFGYGAAKPRVVFVGDRPCFTSTGELAPLAAEEAGLLGRMIAAMRLGSDDVLVTTAAHTVRTKALKDSSRIACAQHTRTFIAALRPELVVTLGAAATADLLVDEAPEQLDRGRLWSPTVLAGAALLTTFHPRELLDVPAYKRLAWSDLQLAMQHLGLNTTPRI